MSLSTRLSSLDSVAAARRLRHVIRKTPLAYNANLSRRYQCTVYLKREDLQVVRSYKLRGAYNLMVTLSAEERQRGVVCASAGNHAQGFAFGCQQLDTKGIVFMPVSTPKQKIRQTKMFGGSQIEIVLTGDTFDDCYAAATRYTQEHQLIFVPPFDHEKIIEGQGTVGVEILEELDHLDYLLIPVGGGGLAAGVGSYVKKYIPQANLIGVEPQGAPSMKAAREAGQPVTLESIERFVDGAAVKRVGALTFPICNALLDDICVVPEGKVCSTILQLYNEDAIVVEPAGALSIAALDFYREQIIGKTVVCIVSGGNNDIDRMPEIKERSLQYEGLKHYFLIQFAQRPGALKQFVSEILGPTDDITRFEYIQKTNKESGPALIGVEVLEKEDYQRLLEKMQAAKINFVEIRNHDPLLSYLI